MTKLLLLKWCSKDFKYAYYLDNLLHDHQSDLQLILQTPIKKGNDVWIADTARVFGLVTLGDACSVWFGAVLRGDTDTINVGNRSNIQENAVVHVDPGFPTQIGHDCIIGDYFSAMPGAIVSGNVSIHDLVYMGTNSSIKEKLSIHSLSTIGMNSCVVKSIKDSGVYVGTPAKKIK
jgi:carbonic anhydrase/acetyltransferase-like protein (isoleucine patch superfamily)